MKKENYKKNITLMLTTLLVVLFASFVNAASPALRVGFVNQDPSVGTPGKYVDLKFQIENIGDDDAQNVIIELIPEYPFSLDPNEISERNIGNMASGRIGKDSVQINYRVRIDEKSVQGQNKIKLRYKFGTSASWTYQEYDVFIESSSYIVTITDVKTTPSELKPGDKAKIEIKIKNLGYKTVRDLSLKMILSSYTGNILNSLIPIAPTSSTTEKRINFLESDKELTFTYDMIVEPNAQAGVYKVPVVLSYIDYANQEKINEGIIGLIIGSSPELTFEIVNNEVMNPNTNAKLKIEITNKGMTDSKFTNIIPKETEEFKILSSRKEIYVGSVDSDDYESFDLEIFIKDTTKESINIPLEVSYKDSNNREYNEFIELNLKLYSIEQAKELGLIKSQPFPIQWVVIGIVIAVFIFFKIKKKKDRKKN